MTLDSKKREDYLEKMTQTQLDLLIIGGGITGAGIALDSTLRGMKVGLVEMQDFAAGTSSRSTKLIHGGLRYLKQMDFKLVAEVGKEREIVYENAPHVTVPEKMMLPFYKNGSYGRISTSIGLTIYDYLAGVKKSERRSILNKEETLKRAPVLKEENLLGSGIYVEYKTDDSRLTIEVIKKAADYGAQAVNYVKVIEFIYNEKKLIGVAVRDLLNDKYYKIFAKAIVNATGIWVDKLRELDKSRTGMHILLSKGVHLVFSQEKFPLDNAVYFDNTDGRMIFTIPRNGKTYVGTTDTFYEGEICNPRMTEQDQTYLLESVNKMFPSLKLTFKDIEANWAGIRSLIHQEGKSPSEISRRDEISLSNSGLISIAGGKLTGYRKMAEKAVNIATKQLAKEGIFFKKSNTKNQPLSGGDVGGSEGFPLYIEEKVKVGIEVGLTFEEANFLARLYGSNVQTVYQYLGNYPNNSLSKVIYSSLMYGIQKEMVITPLDYFNRRTGTLYFNSSFISKWREPVISFMTDYFNWTSEERELYTTEFENEVAHSTLAFQTRGDIDGKGEIHFST